jgi:hypothetical protein
MRRTRVYIDSMLSVAAACIGLKMWLPSARIACDHFSPVDILLCGSAFRKCFASQLSPYLVGRQVCAPPTRQLLQCHRRLPIDPSFRVLPMACIVASLIVNIIGRQGEIVLPQRTVT